MAHLAVGNLDSADRQLAEVVDMAEGSGAAASGALALAERAVVAIDRREWTQAELLAEQARSVVHHAGLDRDVTSILLDAAAARLAIHHAEVPRARAELAHAQRLRPQLRVPARLPCRSEHD